MARGGVADACGVVSDDVDSDGECFRESMRDAGLLAGKLETAFQLLGLIVNHQIRDIREMSEVTHYRRAGRVWRQFGQSHVIFGELFTFVFGLRGLF